MRRLKNSFHALLGTHSVLNIGSLLVICTNLSLRSTLRTSKLIGLRFARQDSMSSYRAVSVGRCRVIRLMGISFVCVGQLHSVSYCNPGTKTKQRNQYECSSLVHYCSFFSRCVQPHLNIGHQFRCSVSKHAG